MRINYIHAPGHVKTPPNMNSYIRGIFLFMDLSSQAKFSGVFCFLVEQSTSLHHKPTPHSTDIDVQTDAIAMGFKDEKVMRRVHFNIFA